MTSIQYNALLKFANQESEESLSFFDKLPPEAKEAIIRMAIFSPTTAALAAGWNYLKPKHLRTTLADALKGGLAGALLGAGVPAIRYMSRKTREANDNNLKNALTSKINS